jgi:hypothetical protein
MLSLEAGLACVRLFWRRPHVDKTRKALLAASRAIAVKLGLLTRLPPARPRPHKIRSRVTTTDNNRQQQTTTNNNNNNNNNNIIIIIIIMTGLPCLQKPLSDGSFGSLLSAKRTNRKPFLAFGEIPTIHPARYTAGDLQIMASA